MEKPFPCRVSTCPQSFATEDHLAVHQKTHEIMRLNLDGHPKEFIGQGDHRCNYFPDSS